MPKFLENKLKREYPNNPHAVYGTLNAKGYMRGSRETAKGAKLEAKHERDVRQHIDSGHHNVVNKASHARKLRNS
jgi:hypothetical protein